MHSTAWDVIYHHLVFHNLLPSHITEHKTIYSRLYKRYIIGSHWMKPTFISWIMVTLEQFHAVTPPERYILCVTGSSDKLSSRESLWSGFSYKGKVEGNTKVNAAYSQESIMAPLYQIDWFLWCFCEKPWCQLNGFFCILGLRNFYKIWRLPPLQLHWPMENLPGAMEFNSYVYR